ncbi:MAG: hypothetical protein IT447_11910 [Phycisphaerales bacterium]|jgi:hypothetical protein|nr:hypothetical protein [Phycisphaerales bacterium]
MTATGMTTLDTLLNQFRDDPRNNRDLGDRFELAVGKITTNRTTSLELWHSIGAYADEPQCLTEKWDET